MNAATAEPGSRVTPFEDISGAIVRVWDVEVRDEVMLAAPAMLESKIAG